MKDYENYHWWQMTGKKDEDEETCLKKALDRIKDLYDTCEDFRSEAWRYFSIVDYKSYNPEKEGIEKDGITEENLLTNPYLTLNVTSSCVETCATKIAKAKPKVTFLTKDADRERRELARKLDNWILKTFKKAKVWGEASQAFKSSCVCGLGVLKVYIEKSRVRIKKVPIFDMVFNNAHRGSQTPEEAGEIKFLMLSDLIEMFPSKKEELEEAHGEKMSESIKVYELYRQYKRHKIFTGKVMLVDEKWEKPLPYVFFKFEPSDQGVVSVGIAKKLYAIQNSITYILGKTFTSIKNFAVPRIFLPKGTEPTESDLTNLTAQIYEVSSPDGKVPQFSTPPAVHSQVVEILNLLWIRAFEIIGVSQLSAGGAIPRGLENASGTALRNYQQQESERFQLIRSSYEEGFIKLAKLIIKMSSDSMLPKGIKRSEVMEAKEDINIWTSSLLPETPAGKLAMIGDLFNTGMIQGNQALSLLDSPDTNKFLSSETSRMKAIDLSLDRALEKNEKPIYHASLGLDMYLDRARKMFAEIIVEEGEDSSKLPLLTSCIEELEAKVSQQTGIQDTLNQLTAGQGVPPQTPQEPLATTGAGPEQGY